MLTMATASDKDRFSDLTDDLLKHVLSFLRPDEALQTCVLNTRWRDLWRRTTSLVLIFEDKRSRFPFSENMKKLAKLIVGVRGNSPLLKCQINTYPDDEAVNRRLCKYTHTKLLIDYAITCQVAELVVRTGVNIEYEPLMFDAPLISQHLKSIELECVDLELSALNFSGCPVLEDLKMGHCSIYAREISSESLRLLCITCCAVPGDFHIRICAPGLILLQLDDFHGLTPFLECMPLLVTAYVGLGCDCGDICDRHLQGCDSPDSDCHAHLVKDGVLLNGLSNAVNLELIAEPEMFLYRWDLKWCPRFEKLKTLLLNEWFTAIDLACILQRTSILEMLTLQLGDTEQLARATGAQEIIKQSFVCAHLKVVNIECRHVDQGIFKILKILRTCGILREQISIKDPCSRSNYFSFQKPPHSYDCGPSCCSSNH